MAELFRAGVIVGLLPAVYLVLRGVTQLIVILWSLRADEAGRAHALKLLRLIGTLPRSRGG
jgi:hypothetical protein